MKKINDNTVVKVRVPKHLYEAIKARIAMKENKKAEEPEDEKPKYAGTKMSKSDVLSKVGKGKQSRKVSGDKAKAYQPVHSRVYKEGEEMNENLMDILSTVDMETLGMIATALGITGGAAKLAQMIKNEKGQPGGSTGTYTEGNLNEYEIACVERNGMYYKVNDEGDTVSGPYTDEDCTRRKR